MDNSKKIFEEEKRVEKSNAVIIKFTEGNFFNVIDEKHKVKYAGRITEDMCTCPSFEYGNTDEYLNSHGVNFQCKHLIKAHLLKSVEAEKIKQNKEKCDSVGVENTQGLIKKDLLIE